MMLTRFSNIGRGLAGAAALVVLTAMAGPAFAEMKILVVDQQSILRDSLAGQDIGRQATVLRDQIGQELEAERNSIISAEKDLTANASVLSPSQREQQGKDLNDRKRNYPVFEQRKNQVFQLSVARATNEVAAVLKPLLQELIDEKKADILVDRQSVLFVANEYDITAEATTRLNAKIKSVKVERVDLDQPAASSEKAEDKKP